MQWTKIARWLTVDAPRAWVAVLVPAVSFGISVLLARQMGAGFFDETSFRLTGMFLQLGGLILVAIGLVSTQRQFKVSGPKEWIENWADQGAVLMNKPTAPHTTGPTTTPILLTVVSDEIKLGPMSVEMPHDIKIEALTANVRILKNEIEEQRRLFREHLDGQKYELQEQLDALHRNSHELQTNLLSFSTGGLRLEWMGIFWLGLGAVFGALSPELANAFS